MKYRVDIEQWAGQSYDYDISSVEFDTDIEAIDHAKSIVGDDVITTDNGNQYGGYAAKEDFREYAVLVRPEEGDTILQLYTDSVDGV